MNDIQYMNEFDIMRPRWALEGDRLYFQIYSAMGRWCLKSHAFSHILRFFFLDRTTCCVR